MKAGHPEAEVRTAAGRLSDALMATVGATAIYVRAIASDHDSTSREDRANGMHEEAVRS